MSPPSTEVEQARPVWTSDEGTMAQDTAASRWPRIVQDMVDDLEESIAEAADRPAAQAERASIRDALVALRDEIARDAALQ